LKKVQIYELVNHPKGGSGLTDPQERSKNVGLRLLGLAAKCRAQSMSGRGLRRLPVLALARYIGVGNLGIIHPTSEASRPGEAQTRGVGAQVELWLDGMERAVNEQAKEQERLV
jgi:hypothetical protein